MKNGRKLAWNTLDASDPFWSKLRALDYGLSCKVQRFELFEDFLLDTIAKYFHMHENDGV